MTLFKNQKVHIKKHIKPLTTNFSFNIPRVSLAVWAIAPSYMKILFKFCQPVHLRDHFLQKYIKIIFRIYRCIRFHNIVRFQYRHRNNYLFRKGFNFVKKSFLWHLYLSYFLQKINRIVMWVIELFHLKYLLVTKESSLQCFLIIRWQ